MRVISNHSSSSNGFPSFVPRIAWAVFARCGVSLRRALHDSRTRQAAREIHNYRHLVQNIPTTFGESKLPDQMRIANTTVVRDRSNNVSAFWSYDVMLQRILAIASIAFFVSIHIVALYKVDAIQHVEAPEKIMFGHD
jgi:hypothetical protein